MPVEKDPALPLYRQVYEAIRRSILEGELSPATRLPASRALAAHLGISRMTVINAYEQLLAEGYLEGKAGSGTFVAARLPEEFLQAPHQLQKPLQKMQKVQKERDSAARPRKLRLTSYGRSLSRDFDQVLRGNGETSFAAFQHGIPAVDKFPFDIWAKIYGKVFHAAGGSQMRRDVFGYGDPAGHFPLRSAIAAHLRSARGVNCDAEQVIITNGAQQAFDLAGRVLLEPGAPVWVEDPCHAGAKNSFGLSGAKLVPVAVDKEGFDLDRAVKKNIPAQMIYVTPSHQFPLGVTMSLSRRLSLLEWAKNNEAWIIEDDYDSEFRYAGRPLASLQGLDKDDRVIYVGTFSKTIYPALRIGCLVVPKDMVKVFTAARALSGGNSPAIDQAVLADFIGEGHFARHIRRMRRLYQERQALLIAEVRKHLTGRLEVEKMDSGMHLIGTPSAPFKAGEIVESAARAGIKITAVSSYALTRSNSNDILLGYAGLSEKQIKEGVKKLTTVFEKLSK